MCISSGLMQKITTPASHHWVSLASWPARTPCRSRSHRQACVYEAAEKNPAIEEETCNFLSGCNYICFWVSVSYEHLIYELRLAAVSGASQTCLDITQSQRPDTNTLAPGTKKAKRNLDRSLRQWIRFDCYMPAVWQAGVNLSDWKMRPNTCNIISFHIFVQQRLSILFIYCDAGLSIYSNNIHKIHNNLHKSWEKTQSIRSRLRTWFAFRPFWMTSLVWNWFNTKFNTGSRSN